MNLWKRLGAGASAGWRAAMEASGLAGSTRITDERGRRTTPENALKYMYQQFWVDPELRATILEIRTMDREDGRVKKIHSRMAMDITRGGLTFTQKSSSADLRTRWEAYQRRTHLDSAMKLKSDARAFVLQGNLPIQWVLTPDLLVDGAVAMPADTIRPNVTPAGKFADVARAYIQYDVLTGLELAAFPSWKMSLGRLDPDSYDDLGCMGRPLLDAIRTTHKKLGMTEEDLVIRRRTRAAQRFSHVLEGATPEQVDAYQLKVEADQQKLTTDFYSNKKGGVTALQGDAALDQISDVVHLLDTFFAGTPIPKGLMGYTDELNRDVLQDIIRVYFDEIDVAQDTLAWVYQEGFRLELLLAGINPDAEDLKIEFSERRTETANQTADRLLKYQALGVPPPMLWQELSLDPDQVNAKREEWAKQFNPYPTDDSQAGRGTPIVSVTPGNAPKAESATSITNAGGQ
jgi:hypothetical protein